MNSKTIAAAFVMVVALLKGVAFADEPAPLYVREVQINAQIDDIRFVQRAVVTNVQGDYFLDFMAIRSDLSERERWTIQFSLEVDGSSSRRNWQIVSDNASVMMRSIQRHV